MYRVTECYYHHHHLPEGSSVRHCDGVRVARVQYSRYLLMEHGIVNRLRITGNECKTK